MDPADSIFLKACNDFENRLLDHKEQHFKGVPFPYAKQQSLQWKLYGPYDNKGNVSAAFPPEQKNSQWDPSANTQTAIGRTIILRHRWYPLIKGVIANASDSATWYAKQESGAIAMK